LFVRAMGVLKHSTVPYWLKLLVVHSNSADIAKHLAASTFCVFDIPEGETIVAH
jgi:hypothetical protein